METQSKNLTKAEAEQFIDSYFNTLGNKLEAYIKQTYSVQALVLKTADDINLEFPEDIQESGQITEGTSPVKIDGKLADGKFTMPDGVILRIEKGVVKEIIQPTPEEIAALIKRDMKAFRSQLKAFIGENGRKPFKRTGYLKKTK